MRRFALIGALVSAAMSLPIMNYAASAGQALMIEAAPAPARNRARRRALVASGYSLKRSRGAPARRKVRTNRLHVSRRVRRRHRRQRAA